MRLPRDLSGAELVKRLARLGYAATRQTGSHIRLTSHAHGEHHVTIPNMIRCASAPWRRFSTAWPPITA